jgi:hypothetical protein
MVAVGLGMEAICLYLGLSQGALHNSVIRLGLTTPPDRPLRKPGARGWSVLDIMRLIAWRVAGIHPETIAARLSTPKLPRSANAVRAKARRLGLKPPARTNRRLRIPLTAHFGTEPSLRLEDRALWNGVRLGPDAVRMFVSAAGPRRLREP